MVALWHAHRLEHRKATLRKEMCNHKSNGWELPEIEDNKIVHLPKLHILPQRFTKLVSGKLNSYAPPTVIVALIVVSDSRATHAHESLPLQPQTPHSVMFILKCSCSSLAAHYFNMIDTQ